LQLRITLSQPAAEVRALVELAAEGIDTEGLSVWVKNCSRAFAGRAYFEAQHCVVRIGGSRHFPIRRHHYPRLKTAPVYDLNSWQEALVLVTAHELRHQQQYRHGWRRSEVDAERWALDRLSAFRMVAAPNGAMHDEQRVAVTSSGEGKIVFPKMQQFEGKNRC
jgi:hypothetical protein